MVVNFELNGQKFMGLNGGPQFAFNPSISMFVISESDSEIDDLWKQLLEGGSVMMPLDKYDWSEKFGYLKDRFGLAWQIMKGKLSDVNQKITPTFLFTNEQYGRAESAVKFYTSVFPKSEINGILLYEDGDEQPKGKVKHAQFALNGQVFMAMDGSGSHDFAFNEALSFVVTCDTQEEIDTYWNKLSEGGSESMCGWLKDRFGVSWQIVPSVLGKLMSDPAKSPRVMQAFLKMKKFDIEKLMEA